MREFNDLKIVDEFDYILLNDYEKNFLKSEKVELFTFENVTDNVELENEILENNNHVEGMMYNGYSFLIYPNINGTHARATDYYDYFSIKA